MSTIFDARMGLGALGSGVVVVIAGGVAHPASSSADNHRLLRRLVLFILSYSESNSQTSMKLPEMNRALTFPPPAFTWPDTFFSTAFMCFL